MSPGGPKRRKARCRSHTIRRVRERYGLEITNEEYEDMIIQALEPDSIVLNRDDGSTLNEVIVQGVPVLVLLDQTGTIIKTAYPQDASVMYWKDPA